MAEHHWGPLHLQSDEATLKRELHRKGFHMIAGVAVTPFVLYAGLEYATALAASVLFFLATLEVLYWRFGFRVPLVTQQFTAIRREGETYSWASTLFLAAILIILWLVPLPAAFATLAMLALGDGTSAIAGRAFGRHKLFYNRNKSWEGTAAGFLAGTAGGIWMAWWYYAVREPNLISAWPGAQVIPIVVVGALAAAIVESLPTKEDNLSVPLAAGITMTAVWYLVGLAPRSGELFLRVLGP